MKIAREGYPLILAAAVVTILTFVLGWVAIGVILGICTLAIAAFFRDPERTIPTGEGLIVSPADGRVVSIAYIKDDPKFAEAAARVASSPAVALIWEVRLTPASGRRRPTPRRATVRAGGSVARSRPLRLTPTKSVARWGS